jgi:cysteine protease ATG4
MVASDAMVAVDDVSHLLSDSAVLLLVPLRLGVEKLNVSYIQPLLSMFTLPQFAGFIGGQQSSSFFFVGAEIPVDPASTDGYCYYLDPHLVQESDHTGVGSYKVLDVGRITIGSLDPSLSLGFYIRDSTEWEILTASIKSVWAGTEFPLFTLLSAEDSMKLQDVPSGLEFAVDDFDMS